MRRTAQPQLFKSGMFFTGGGCGLDLQERVDVSQVLIRNDFGWCRAASDQPAGARSA